MEKRRELSAMERERERRERERERERGGGGGGVIERGGRGRREERRGRE
jgi:hypothetical protein